MCLAAPPWQTEAGDAPEIGLPFWILPDWTSHTPRTSAPLLVSFLFSSLFLLVPLQAESSGLGGGRSLPTLVNIQSSALALTSAPITRLPPPPLVRESFGQRRASLSDFCACTARLLVICRGWVSSQRTDASLCACYYRTLLLALEWSYSAPQ